MSAPAAPSFRAVAAGHGGIEDLRKHINEATVRERRPPLVCACMWLLCVEMLW
ncbi:MAG: hypothetical protein P4L40_24850 [Terracidiphilus sp.]|nr:hypothetical protein [Terracidiphilus sp.]